ncbi:hypothetical protein THAOC_05728, partial [Thalassiosira oceanica]
DPSSKGVAALAGLALARARAPFSEPWGPLPAGGLGPAKTLQTFAANHGQTYRGRALLVENFQRAETAKPVPPV